MNNCLSLTKLFTSVLLSSLFTKVYTLDYEGVAYLTYPQLFSSSQFQLRDVDATEQFSAFLMLIFTC